MKTVEEWFSDYGVCHQNPINKKIHFICVPVIFFTSIGMIWAIPSFSANPYINYATIAMGIVFLYYARLSVPLAIANLFFFVLSRKKQL